VFCARNRHESERRAIALGSVQLSKAVQMAPSARWHWHQGERG
jgi:hypothetical protein